ncbi:MAG: hypothetical protein R3F19_18380 [Verrucomicrobiales bacterium]
MNLAHVAGTIESLSVNQCGSVFGVGFHERVAVTDQSGDCIPAKFWRRIHQHAGMSLSAVVASAD